MSSPRRAISYVRAILRDRSFQGLLALGALAFCGFAWHSCSQARDEAAAVRVAAEGQAKALDVANAILKAQRELLQSIAGQTRNPLRADWTATDGLHYEVVLSYEDGWTDEQFQASFDAKVERNRKSHPPVRPEPQQLK